MSNYLCRKYSVNQIKRTRVLFIISKFHNDKVAAGQRSIVTNPFEFELLCDVVNPWVATSARMSQPWFG